MSNVHYLDLDAIEPEHKFTVKLNGKEHTIQQTSLEGFVTNAKAIRELGVGGDILDEVEVSIGIILRSVPSLPEAELRAINFLQLNAIRDFIMTANGEKVEEKDTGAEDASGNEAKVAD